MSFTLQPSPVSRPNRSQLFVPGSRPELFEKAAKSQADVINLDLEDSVKPDSKSQARKNIAQALNDVDWNTKTVSVRINALDTPYWYEDLIEVLSKGQPNLIMIPKVGNASDVYAVDALVTALETNHRYDKKTGFEVIIETAAGVENAVEIAASSKRMQAMSLGVADYAASMGMCVTGIGGEQADYAMLDPNGTKVLADPWHYPMVRMVAACRLHGLLPVDGPFGDFSNDAAYLAQAQRSATLGCVGKWAIHPKQVALANQTFTPSQKVIDEAKAILDALNASPDGAVVLDGKLIDIASIRQAQVIMDQVKKLSVSQ